MPRKPDVEPAAVRALLDRVFGISAPVSHERTPGGVSAQVYRLRRGAETFYLRIAEEADENLETDAELHERLLDAGVRVARVVHVEAFDARIGRSVMITTEVPGEPLAEVDSPEVAARVLADAGADLARLNRMPVDGFGWVRRHGRGWPLRAEHPTYPAFVTSELPDSWPGPLASLLPGRVLDAIGRMVEHERNHPPAGALLAHGDFDTTPVFCAAGRYTGLIDFGEIRGTEPTFDLGHFLLHDTGTTALLPALLAGYQRVHPLPPDHGRAIRRSAVLLAVRQLCRWIGPVRGLPLEHPAVTRRARRIVRLSTPGPAGDG